MKYKCVQTNTFKALLFFICLTNMISNTACLSTLNFTMLNRELEQLSPSFIHHFNQIYTYDKVAQLTDQELGNYLFLIGKLYIYNWNGLTPLTQESNTFNYESKSNFLLGYFYLKTAAEKYENPDAYYYLALLEYMKMTPAFLIKYNIKKIAELVKTSSLPQDLMKQWKEYFIENDAMINGKEDLMGYLKDISFDMEAHHLHNTEHNLYLASLYGQVPAQLSLAYLSKNGIGTEKNCSTALGYYLSVLKSSKIDIFEFPSEYQDTSNFETQLYSQNEIDLRRYGEYDTSVLMETEIFDSEGFKEYENIAMNYLSGENGFTIDEKKSLEMFDKIKDYSKIARIMLGFMYLKGRGGPKDPSRARTIFEAEANSSVVARETILTMKYFSLGYQGGKEEAIKTMQNYYEIYEYKMNISDSANKKSKEEKESESEEYSKYKKENFIFRTPMIKYLVGSLVLADEINGRKDFAILLIDEAAKEGNTLAILQMALIMLDGSDASFDCEKSAEYFSKEALSYKSFQQRIEIAKIGIKNEKYLFSFIKYVQLMMVGYKNSFINAFYLTNVYGDKIFQFNQKSWSVANAKTNDVYKLLLKLSKVDRIENSLLETFSPSNLDILIPKNMELLTTVNNEQSNENQVEETINPEISEYTEYINKKIIEIGIQKHEISILKFFKYKQTKDINLLHSLANTGESSLHIYESRFLLGRYYQHTNISGSVVENRHRRAREEYSRATKSKFLSDLIYFIEGGETVETDKILSRALWYLTILILIGIFMYWKKNSILDARLAAEEEAMQINKNNEERTNEELGISEETSFPESEEKSEILEKENISQEQKEESWMKEKLEEKEVSFTKKED